MTAQSMSLLDEGLIWPRTQELDSMFSLKQHVQQLGIIAVLLENLQSAVPDACHPCLLRRLSCCNVAAS